MIKTKHISLPSPKLFGNLSIEEAIAKRRSVFSFSKKAPGRAQIAQVLWAGQGITGTGGLRASPSAGAIYPLDLFLVGAEGVTRYRPVDHSLEFVMEQDLRPMIVEAAGEQDWISQAPVIIVVSADLNRLRSRFGDRAERLAHLEAGHVSQNILLEAVSIGLGGSPVGDFDPVEVNNALHLDGAQALYLIALGIPQRRT